MMRQLGVDEAKLPVDVFDLVVEPKQPAVDAIQDLGSV